MFKWDEFTQEFRIENDNIKPSQDFKARLSAAVREETSSNVIQYRKRHKVVGTVAAACAVLVIGAGVYGIAGNSLSKSGGNDNINSDVEVVAGDNKDNDVGKKEWSYHFKADSSSEAVDLNAVAAALSGNAMVMIDGKVADDAAKQELSDALDTHNIVEESSNQKVSSYIQINGDDTWIIEEYENGDLYIHQKEN